MRLWFKPEDEIHIMTTKQGKRKRRRLQWLPKQSKEGIGASLELKSRAEQRLVKPEPHCVPGLPNTATVPPGALPVWWAPALLRVRRDDAQLTLGGHFEGMFQVVPGVGVLQLIEVVRSGLGMKPDC